ncbi:MAG: hypothetical protein ACYC6A_03690 [Armatimonadota bacterium]
MAGILAMLFVANASAVAAHHSPQAPVPLCETIECGDPDEPRLESLPASTIVPLQASAHIVVGAMSVRHLSPIIYQPPEAA